jgi:hypothetical protein
MRYSHVHSHPNAQGMHAASSLLKRVSPDAAPRGKEFYNEHMVNNHVR